MNNIVQIAKSYLFELCLIALLVKTMISGSTIADALVLISLVVSICYAKHYLGKKETNLNDEQAEKLEQVSKNLNSLMAINSIKRGVIGDNKK